MSRRRSEADRSFRLRRLAVAVVLGVAGSVVAAFAPEPAAAASVPEITLPIAVDHIDSVQWTDTWGAPRSGGRSHVGVDMLGPKMTPLVAAADGTITWMRHSSTRGNILYLTDDEGWQYTYIHINNDTPGTDDGVNRYEEAFAPGIERGARVEAGQVSAYMGDSGNAEWTVSHLHFEIVSPEGYNVNPAPIVDAARDQALRTVPSVDPARVAPFASFDEMADNLYRVVHGRSANNAELATLATTVNQEGLDAALASVIGPNTAGASLDRLYEAYFLRQADTAGFNYWMDQLQAGAELTEIAEWFADSEEFRARYAGLGFADFLDQLYRDVLGRDPDETGKDYWLDLLDRGLLNRGTIVVQFTEGAELIQVTEHRSEVTMLSLVFTEQIPSSELEQQWRSLRLNTDLRGSVRSTYLQA
ncbi:MAG: DUF4214 domain-containing protein [Acidimicrobiia bacterium]|nr:DUF4214 domain-containing protein [Acidimicrobiia bacterium]